MNCVSMTYHVLNAIPCMGTENLHNLFRMLSFSLQIAAIPTFVIIGW